ncbi:hypothetical protein [Priestia flexa]|uniref:Uncharacterized protein n=2 Tax=Priestia flexa TaxID=86664 RepID=A0A8I1SMN1_9BACI|nr:hypothetical protein [Priestia flexa]MBN8251494.1 hypothetical protein [Priestia flexa]
MYDIVKTAKQQKIFQNIWEYFCEKYKWYNDPYSAEGVRYLLIAPTRKFYHRRRFMGTIEFSPYSVYEASKASGVRKYDFSRHAEIYEERTRVWEIDKLCLHLNYQRQGYFSHFFSIFNHHAKIYQPKYYIALVEKKLYRMLRFSYHSWVEQTGPELVGPTTSLIPVIIHIEKMMQEGILLSIMKEPNTH